MELELWVLPHLEPHCRVGATSMKTHAKGNNGHIRDLGSLLHILCIIFRKVDRLLNFVIFLFLLLAWILASGGYVSIGLGYCR